MAENFALPISEKAALEVPNGSWSDLEFVNLARGVIKGGVEDPVNAITQIVNAATGSKIPELHVVDEAKATRTTGGAIGNFISKGLEFGVLAYATRNIAVPASTTGAVLRSGGIGAIYGGVLTPSDAKSETFMVDRLKNAATSFATFSAMSYASAKIDSIGIFAVPEARGLLGSMAYGAATGIAGGVAYSEADALLNKGRLLPTLSDLDDNVKNWAIFGAAMGGGTYGFHKHNAKYIESKTLPGRDDTSVQVRMQVDAAGRPIRIEQQFNTRYNDLHSWDSVLKTDGKWSSSGSGSHYITPKLMEVKIDPKGTIITLDDRGNHRYYTNGQKYESDRTRATDLAEQHAKAGAPTTFEQVGSHFEKRAFIGIKLNETGWVEHDAKGSLLNTVRTDSSLGYRKFDAQGKLLEHRLEWKAKPYDYDRAVGDFNSSWTRGTELRYNENGALNFVKLRMKDDAYAYLSSKTPGVWEFKNDKNTFQVKGEVQVTKPGNMNSLGELNLVGSGGLKTRLPINDPDSISDLLMKNLKSLVKF